jgi:hypothetical protein
VVLSPQDLQRKLTDLEEFYAKRNQNFMGWRDFYFLKKEAYFQDNSGKYADPDPDEVRVILPIAQIVVNGFMELLFTKPPVLSVPASRVDSDKRLQAEHNEKALWAIWSLANIYQQIIDSLWFGLVDGWGVLQCLWNKDAEEYESPVAVLAQDPHNVYPCPGDIPGTWRYVIHAYERTVAQLKEKWVNGKDGRTKSFKVANESLSDLDDTKTVTLIDYWDAKVNAVGICYELEDQPDGVGDTRMESRWLKPPKEHGYGSLPWVIYFPSRLPFRGIGERMGLSVLFIIQELLKYLCVLVSEKATWIRRWQEPPLVTYSEQGENFTPVLVESKMHLKMGVDEKAEYLVHPAQPTGIDEQIGMILEFIERATLPKALQGVYEGQMSGIAMSLLRNPTLMKIAFKQEAIEQALEELNKIILRLLERFLKGNRNLWSRSTGGVEQEVEINPETIGGYYENRVKLSASLPTDDASTVNSLLALLQGGVLSAPTVRDVAQQTLHDLVPQSLVDEQKLVLADKVMQNPQFIMALAMQVAQEIDPVLGQYMQQAAAQNPQAGGPPGNPAMGDRELTLPAGTMASQTPGMPGGNTRPTMEQRIQEMNLSSPASSAGQRYE